MMHWILLFTIYVGGYGGASSITAVFDDKAACVAAAEEHKQKYGDPKYTYWTCARSKSLPQVAE